MKTKIPKNYHPILFTDEMVRAILDGRKTQTRRICKVQPSRPNRQAVMSRLIDSTAREDKKNVGKLHWAGFVGGDVGFEWSDREYFRNPYGGAGSTLWVREAWGLDNNGASPGHAAAYVSYRSDRSVWHQHIDDRRGSPTMGLITADQKWKPNIHMFFWACRLFLKVTNVRVEQLDDISDADCIAEGIEPNGDATDEWIRYPLEDNLDGFPAFTPRESYESLWESINGEDSWDLNPWVWVVEFERIDR